MNRLVFLLADNILLSLCVFPPTSPVQRLFLIFHWEKSCGLYQQNCSSLGTASVNIPTELSRYYKKRPQRDVSRAQRGVPCTNPLFEDIPSVVETRRGQKRSCVFFAIRLAPLFGLHRDHRANHLVPMSYGNVRWRP